MEEIKRYDCEGCSGYCYGGYHMEDAGEYGDYVKAEDFDRVVAALEADRDALRKDAGRYRFIKESRVVLAGGPWPIAPFGEECDRKIDAAIAAKGAQS